MTPIPSGTDATLHLPRILCLHGGGVTSHIFRLQCRILIAHLGSTFRFCFADAPFVSGPGPGIYPTYQKYGPFRRWLRWKHEDALIDNEICSKLILDSLADAMAEDDDKGATGEWIGLLGFSQGAKIAASVLLMQDQLDLRQGKLPQERQAGFRFALLLAGSAPLVSLNPEFLISSYLADASQVTSFTRCIPQGPHRVYEGPEHLIHSPTVHVHGLEDPGLPLHRQLLDKYCADGSARVVEWNGEHRVPIKQKDVGGVVEAILQVAKDTVPWYLE